MTASETDKNSDHQKARFDNLVEHHLRRNYSTNLLYGLFSNTGFRLINAPTVLPVYIMTLSGSNMIVGMLRFFGSLVGFISLFTAVPFAEKPLLRNRVVAIGLSVRAQYLFMALSAFFLPRNYLLPTFFLYYGLYRFFMGYQGIIYRTIMSKVIPVRIRGSFTSYRTFLGGIATAFMFAEMGRLLDGMVFPNEFAWTYLSGFILTTIGLGCFALVKEPASPVAFQPRQSFFKLWRQIWDMTHADRSFRNYVIVLILHGAGLMGGPFYILYIRDVLNISFAEVAFITTYLTAASTISTLLWGQVADRLGFRSIFIIGLLIYISSIALLILAPLTLTMAKIVYILKGIGTSAFGLGMGNIVLEFGTIEDRARRIAATNLTNNIINGLAPLIGGILSDVYGYVPVFLASLACLASAVLLLYLKVEEPRFAVNNQR